MSCSNSENNKGDGEQEQNQHVLQRSVEKEPRAVVKNGSISAPQLTIDQNLLVDPKLLFIGSKIGEGAHGKVYEGRYGDRIVAIKVLHRGSTSDERAALENRFIREVNMMSRVKHENLVKFLGACKDPLMVIVTELLPGMSLRKYLVSLRPNKLDLHLALNFALDIARAMDCLHANGIIHRDLKPDQKSLKLADFGLAREETVTEMMTAETGTYRWMAPELYSTVTLRQGEKKHYNNKVDVYSFGIVLWELLTNRMPFEGMSNLQAAYAAAFKHARPSLPEDISPRISFLEAVRASSFAPEVAVPPTNKMYEAVFQILRVGKSLELIMSSYQLLIDLDKHFPQVYVSKSSSIKSHELVVVDEAWSPFAFHSDVASNERQAAGENASGLLEFSGFTLLIEGLADIATVENIQEIDIKNLRTMLLFQYIVSFLEGDFLPRSIMYAETMNWTILRESFLNMLLGSRRINYKNLMKDCLSILCGLSQVHTGTSDNRECPENSDIKPADDGDTALAFALLEVGKNTCISMQKFLIVIMELDTAKKNADIQGQTTRADGVSRCRTPVVEIVLDELTYNVDMLWPFLQVFDQPKWKLEIIVQYFSKYTTKPSVRTRRSNSSVDDAMFTGILNWFSSGISSKNVVKKISIEVIQLLLAHGFQAQLVLSSQHIEDIIDSKEETRETSLVEICKNMICAFQSLRRTDEKMEILPIAKEALFTAATILSTN